MDVTKTQPPGPSSARSPSGSAPDSGSQAPSAAVAAADRADIRPLDVPAALQILLAEVRSSLESTALSLGNAETSLLADAPPQAARAVLQLFLQSIPQDAADLPAWTAAVAQAETALQAGLGRALAAIGSWRAVTATVLDAAKETQAQIFSALADDAQNPAWVRPEWAGLAPRLQRFWRRRRLARRQLTDPDHLGRSVDDNDV